MARYMADNSISEPKEFNWTAIYSSKEQDDGYKIRLYVAVQELNMVIDSGASLSLISEVVYRFL
jgi:hypothetical protein